MGLREFMEFCGVTLPLFQGLEGRTILGLAVSHDQHFLRFETEMGPLTFITEGDCCSETWFADVCGVDALLGARILRIDVLPLPKKAPVDGRCRKDIDKQYGVKFVTTKGWCDVIFRNSSNGYYGGWVEGPLEQEAPDARVLHPQVWTAITADWSA